MFSFRFEIDRLMYIIASAFTRCPWTNHSIIKTFDCYKRAIKTLSYSEQLIFNIVQRNTVLRNLRIHIFGFLVIPVCILPNPKINDHRSTSTLLFVITRITRIGYYCCIFFYYLSLKSRREIFWSAIEFLTLVQSFFIFQSNVILHF